MLGYAPLDTLLKDHAMGKGDRKTAKGKRNISSYGNARSAQTKSAVGKTAPAKKSPVVAKKAVTKAPAKKAAAK
jgi:30S ribosomal protein S31